MNTLLTDFTLPQLHKYLCAIVAESKYVYADTGKIDEDLVLLICQLTNAMDIVRKAEEVKQN